MPNFFSMLNLSSFVFLTQIKMIQTLEIPPRKKREYLPDDFTVSSWEDLEPWFRKLEAENPQSVQELEAWVARISELDLVIFESKAWLFIKMTCNTEDKNAAKDYEVFLKEVLPHFVKYDHRLLKKLHGSPYFAELDTDYYNILIRSVKNQIDLYRDENISLEAEIQSRAREFDLVAGSIGIEYEGEKITLQKAASMMESTDRKLRETMWLKIWDARMEHREKLDVLYTDLVKMRHQVAQNAGFDSYSDYKFRKLERYDYKREDCFKFHESIEKAVKPLYESYLHDRKERLGLPGIKPWDLTVDMYGGQPLRPFEGTEDLVNKTAKVLRAIDPQLGNYVRIMEQMGRLDLGSRLGKAPGGYNYSMPETGVPFIFMNAVGSQVDIVTMLHEAGHAVHSFLTHDIDLSDFKKLPSEVAELASMAMELISMDQWHLLYEDPSELYRAKREQIIRPFSLLPWIASIDALQHWAYDNPKHTEEERRKSWRSIYHRFHGEAMDTEGLDSYFDSLWQKQGHVFDVPFYYIEYGIAQLGAIAVWRNYKKDPQKALQDYLSALSLGYTRTIPEVYETAGIRFDFSTEYIQELCDFVREELEALDRQYG